MSDVLEVTVAWGRTILDVVHLQPGEHFALDDDSPYGGIEAQVPPGSTLLLAQATEGEARVWLPEGVSGGYLVGEVPTELPASQAQSLVLHREGRVRAEVGALTLYFARVPAAGAVARRGLGALIGDLRSIGTAAVLHALVVFIALALPPTPDSMALDRLEQDDRYVEVLLKPTEPQVEEILAPADVGDEAGGDGPEAEPEAQPSGSQPDPVRGSGTASPKSREEQEEIARGAANQVTSAIDQLGIELMAGGSPLGEGARNALASLDGTGDGRGDALGGGDDLFGAPWGSPTGRPGRSLGIRGVRTGPRGRIPRAVTRAGTRKPKTPPRVVRLDPVVQDGLKKDEIQRVVRRHRSEVRHCYERALQTYRDLEGKVSVRFVVGPDGKVLNARLSESTMGRPEVAQCMVRRIKSWQFPRPRGGGVVAVTYPFMFKPS